MARAFIEKELHVEVKNETGLLGRITSTLSLEGISIVHLSAYSLGERGYLQMLTRDNTKAKKALSHFIKNIEERDVLIVEFENKVGTLSPVTNLLGKNGIETHYVYGTSGDGFKIVGVFSTDNNRKAADLINKDSGALGVSPSK